MDDVLTQIAEVESQIGAIRAKLVSNPKRELIAEMEQSLAAAQVELRRLKAASLDFDERISQLESDAFPLRERIKSLSHLTSSTSFRDEEAKEHQSSVSKARLEELEEEELRLMEALEETKIEVEAQEVKVNELIVTTRDTKATWAEIESKYLSDLNGKELELKDALMRLGDKDRSLYEGLRGRLQGSVVAVVHDQVCGYCGVKVSTRTYAKLKLQLGSALGERDRCEECDRFLILPN